LKNDPTSCIYVAYLKAIKPEGLVKARINSPHKVIEWPSTFMYLAATMTLRWRVADPKPGELLMARMNFV
jgi:hypothetical protein